MTIELVVALVSLAATGATALRSFFKTEADVRVLASEVKDISRGVDDMKGRVLAHDAIAVEGRGAHGRLEERVMHLSERIDEKASAESVESIARAMETLRSDMTRFLERIEKKLDERK